MSAQGRRPNSLYIAYPSPHGRSHYAHRPKRFSVRRGRSRTAAESGWGLDVNQSLSQPTRCIPLTPHNAPELTKLQAASCARVRSTCQLQVGPSRPVSACSFSTLNRLSLVLICGIPPASCDSVHLFLYRQPPSDQSRVYQVMLLRTDGVHCQGSAGAGLG